MMEEDFREAVLELLEWVASLFLTYLNYGGMRSRQKIACHCGIITLN